MTTESTYREAFIEVAALAIRDHFRSVLLLLDSTSRERAAQLYGMLIERNGPFGAVVEAMQQDSHRCYKCSGWGHGPAACTDVEPPKWLDVDKRNPEWEAWRKTPRPDYVAHFIRAIVTEALGGAKVEEAYGKILVLPSPYLSRHKQFSVPRLVIEGGAS